MNHKRVRRNETRVSSSLFKIQKEDNLCLFLLGSALEAPLTSPFQNNGSFLKVDVRLHC